MISKASIASILGLSTSQISDEVYNWSIQQFYLITGFAATETSKTFKKYLKRSSENISLPHSGISSIDKILIDGVEQSFTENSDLFINEDTGFIVYTQGFSGMTEVNYKLGAYTHTTLHDTLVTLLCTKGIALFTPELIGFVKSIKIGDYTKEMFAYTNYKDGFLDVLNKEITCLKDQILYGGIHLVKGRIN